MIEAVAIKDLLDDVVSGIKPIAGRRRVYLRSVVPAGLQPGDGGRHHARPTLVETLAAHDGRSVQHTLYAMAQAVVAARGDVLEITLTLPNRHHLLVDLKPFGLDNPNEIFVVTDQPFGLIEATVRRQD